MKFSLFFVVFSLFSILGLKFDKKTTQLIIIPLANSEIWHFERSAEQNDFIK